MNGNVSRAGIVLVFVCFSSVFFPAFPSPCLIYLPRFFVSVDQTLVPWGCCGELVKRPKAWIFAVYKGLYHPCWIGIK